MHKARCNNNNLNCIQNYLSMMLNHAKTVVHHLQCSPDNKQRQHKFSSLSCLLTSQSQSGRSCSVGHPAISSVPKSKTMGGRIPKQSGNAGECNRIDPDALLLNLVAPHGTLSKLSVAKGSSQWWWS